MEKDKLGLATKRIVGDLVTDIDIISCSLNIKNQNELYQHFMPFEKMGVSLFHPSMPLRLVIAFNYACRFIWLTS